LYACLPIGVSMSMSAGSSESAPLFHAIFKLIRPTSSTFIIENENISIIHSHMPAHTDALSFYSDTCLCIIATFNTFVLGRGIESERRRWPLDASAKMILARWDQIFNLIRKSQDNILTCQNFSIFMHGLENHLLITNCVFLNRLLCNGFHF